MTRNPYAPPNQPAVKGIDTNLKLSAMMSIFSFFCCSAFITFTVVLLQSKNDDDRNGGMLFLANTPILMAWVVANAWPAKGRVGFAVAAAGMQFAITICMLIYGIGDMAAVLTINGAIGCLLLILSYVTWLVARRSPVAMPPDFPQPSSLSSRRRSIN